MGEEVAYSLQNANATVAANNGKVYALAHDRLATPVFQRSVGKAEMFVRWAAIAAGLLNQMVMAEHLSVAAMKLDKKMALG